MSAMYIAARYSTPKGVQWDAFHPRECDEEGLNNDASQDVKTYRVIANNPWDAIRAGKRLEAEDRRREYREKELSQLHPAVRAHKERQYRQNDALERKARSSYRRRRYS